MRTAMESIKEMVEVNTILGDPVETPDGTVIVPVSRVSCGFASGGSDYSPGEAGQNEKKPEAESLLPFGGGAGAGISVSPVAFLVVGAGQVRLLPVGKTAFYDRLIDLAPQVVEKIEGILTKNEGQSVNQNGSRQRVLQDELNP